MPQKPRMVCKALDHDEARHLAITARNWWPSGTMVLIGLFLALRREEIAHARWERFGHGLQTYRVTGKFDKTCTLPVHPALQEELAGHRLESGWLFPGQGATRAWIDGKIAWPSEWSEPIHPYSVSNHIRVVYEAAGLRFRPPHVLRHTSITEALDNSSNLRTVMEFARHNEPQQTAGYTRTTMEQLRNVVEGLDFF